MQMDPDQPSIHPQQYVTAAGPADLMQHEGAAAGLLGQADPGGALLMQQPMEGGGDMMQAMPAGGGQSDAESEAEDPAAGGTGRGKRKAKEVGVDGWIIIIDIEQ